MTTDFWPAGGYRLLERNADGWLQPTPAYVAAWLARPELALVPESCRAETRLHKALQRDPLCPVPGSELAALKGADARENYTHFLALRDALLQAGTLQAWLLGLWRSGHITVPPLFIDLVKTERAKYGDGSALHTMVTLRISIHENTRAMLMQKVAAARWYPNFSYTVDGRPYQPPADLQQQLDKARKALLEAETEELKARLHALQTGGLVGALAALTAEMAGLSVAQLRYQVMSLQHGFPPYGAAVKLPPGRDGK